jgi:hypothetical protein
MGAPRGVVLDGEKIRSLLKEQRLQFKQVVNPSQIRMLQRAIQGKSVRKSSAQVIAKGLDVDLHELYQDPNQAGGFERYITIHLKKVESLSGIPGDVMVGNQNPDVLIDMEVDVKFGIADPSEELAEKCAQLIELLEAITKQSKSSAYIRNCGKLNAIIKDLNESGISIYMGHYKFRKGVWPYIDGFDREVALEAIVDHALVVFAENSKSQTITREVDQGTSLEDLEEHLIETQKLLEQESKNELDDEGKFWLNKMRKESEQIFYDLRA